MINLEKNNINEFKKSVQQLYGDRLPKVILFGSYARGEQKESSDIDFLVVLKDKNISTFKEIENINRSVYDMI